MGKYQEASLRTKRGVRRDYEDEWVAVRTSEFLQSIGKTGYGLYANKQYVAGDVIIEYLGKHISDEEAEKKRSYKKLQEVYV